MNWTNVFFCFTFALQNECNKFSNAKPSIWTFEVKNEVKCDEFLESFVKTKNPPQDVSQRQTVWDALAHLYIKWIPKRERNKIKLKQLELIYGPNDLAIKIDRWLAAGIWMKRNKSNRIITWTLNEYASACVCSFTVKHRKLSDLFVCCVFASFCVCEWVHGFIKMQNHHFNCDSCCLLKKICQKKTPHIACDCIAQKHIAGLF